MPTPTKGARLGGSAAHQKLMLANLATSLFEHGRITTTEAKAKRLRPLAERLITFAKRGDLHARRIVMQTIRDKDVVHHLFAEIGPRYVERPGGYTRILKVGPRKGDNAPMALIELVEETTARQSVVREADRARATKSTAKSTSSADGSTATKTASKAAPSARRSGRKAAAAPVETVPAEVEIDDLDTDTVEAVDAVEAAEAPDAVDSAAEVEVTEDAPYGPGSHAPLEDDSEPAGFPVKGNADSMLYHLPGTSHYGRTIAEVWFDSAESAEAAGFELPASQRDDSDDDGLTILGDDDK